MAAASAESTTSNVQALKEWYTRDEVQSTVLEEGSLMGLMPKYTDFKGKTLPIPVVYGHPQGGSATFATAQSNVTNSQEASFALTAYKDYAIARVEREAMLASEGSDDAAWLELAKIAIDGARNTSARSIAIAMYGDGTGTRGQISAGSNTGTATITLADINAISNFEVYQYIQLSSSKLVGGLRTGQAQIQSIDRNAGTLTFSGALTGLITGAAASDYICRAGDWFGVAPGLQSWLVTPSLRPSSAGSDSFFTQDRYADKTRLMGVYHDGSAQPIEEAIIDLERKCAREDARITHMFCNNVQFSQALKSLSSKVVYNTVTENARNATGPVATVGFSGIEFAGAGGKVRLFPDFNCPSTKLFALTLPHWKLYSRNDAPHIFDMNTDQEWLRQAGADQYEVRVGAYYVLGCRAPGKSGFADLAAAV